MKKKRKEYEAEFEKQLGEILERIETRRIERLEEAAAAETIKENEDVIETEDGTYEKAPIGPGGLDPTEIMQSLPEKIQEAFVSQDKELLVAEMQKLPPEEANDIIQKCIASGLWNPGGDVAATEEVPAETEGTN